MSNGMDKNFSERNFISAGVLLRPELDSYLADRLLVGKERLGEEVVGEARSKERVAEEHQAGVLAAERGVQRRRRRAVVVEEMDEALRHGEDVPLAQHLGEDLVVRVRRDEAEVDGAVQHHGRLRRPRVVVRREHGPRRDVDARVRRAQRVQARDLHGQRREPVPAARRAAARVVDAGEEEVVRGHGRRVLARDTVHAHCIYAMRADRHSVVVVVSYWPKVN